MGWHALITTPSMKGVIHMGIKDSYLQDRITDNWQDIRAEIKDALNNESESKEERNGFVLHCLETLIKHCKRINLENDLLRMTNERIRTENSELKNKLRELA